MVNLEKIIENIDKLSNNIIYIMSLSSRELFHSNLWAYFFEVFPILIDKFFDVEEGNYSKHVETQFEDEYKDFYEIYKDYIGIKREKANVDITIYYSKKYDELKKINTNNRNLKDIKRFIIENKFKSIPNMQQLNEYYKSDVKDALLIGVEKPKFLNEEKHALEWKFKSYSQISEILSKFSKREDLEKHHKEFLNRYAEMLIILVSIVLESKEYEKIRLDLGLTEYSKELKRKLKSIRLDDIVGKLRYENYLNDFSKEMLSNISTSAGYSNGSPLMNFEYPKYSDTTKDHEKKIRIGIQIQNGGYRRFIRLENKTNSFEKFYDEMENKWGDIFEKWFDFRYIEDDEMLWNGKKYKSKQTKKYKKYRADFKNWEGWFMYQEIQLNDNGLNELRKLDKRIIEDLKLAKKIFDKLKIDEDFKKNFNIHL